MPRDDGWSVGAVRERCEHLRASLQFCASVSPVEIAQYWPGGAENPGKSGRGPWNYCLMSYCRLMGRSEAAQAGEDPEGVLLAALAADPVSVTLVEGTEWQCHPKSFLALRWMAHADTLLGAILFHIEQIPYLESKAAEDLRAEAIQGTVELQLAMVWVAVHPGCGLPFDPSQRLPEIPPEIQAITPIGIYQILRTYRQANLQGLAQLPALTDGAPNGKRPVFAMWFSHMASESGLSTDTLMRERPLKQLLAQARLSTVGREPAGAGA